MFFKKKSKKEEIICNRCEENIQEEYSYCPHCGNTLIDVEGELREFGMLGKQDVVDEEALHNQFAGNNLGITDKIIGSLVNNLIKTLDRQFKELEKGEVSNVHNGIRIKIGVPQRKKANSAALTRTLTEEQLKKMTGMPRVAAKTSVRRLSDKIVYELKVPGIMSPQDVFVSKLESGYEIKAIGEKKVYINSLPVNLPIRGMSVNNDKLMVEFRLSEE